MTKHDFIIFLESSLDFLDSVEKKNVLDFFQEKFSFCNSDEEEIALIDAFGTPDELVENLKIARTCESGNSFDVKNHFETILRRSLPSIKKEAADEDLIFSKPIQVEKASELVHSMEDREVKTLFGEKVVIENRKEPIEEKVLEPIDEANGLTTEEIRIAKAKTLEKAEGFSQEDAPENDENLNTASRIPLEEEDFVPEKAAPEKQIAKKDFAGLFNRIIPSEKYTKTAKIALLALLTLAVSPILLIVFGLVLSVYAALVAFTAAVACVCFLLMISLIALGVVELVHGFLVLFDSLAAALIELGFGTIFFSLVVAIAALIYEFIFAVVPKWLKWLTKIFTRQTKLLYCFLYGGKA